LKSVLLLLLVLFFVVTPVYGQLLSDATGLVNRLEVKTLDGTFEIKLVSNFNINNFSFDNDEKAIIIDLDSSLENNLAEVIIPKNLLSGNFTFNLNDQNFIPKIQSNENIHFITLNFTGSGNHVVKIFATTYLDGLSEVESSDNLDVNFQVNNENYVIWIFVGIFIIIIIITYAIMKKVKK
tara:strand:+ start:143 stop:685 length:543 start_codon:yes stop_codon:yes gene_type:complete